MKLRLYFLQNGKQEKSSGGFLFRRTSFSWWKKAVTYSPALHCSTIGASGLNFSVRNGKRWNPAAVATWYGGHAFTLQTYLVEEEHILSSKKPKNWQSQYNWKCVPRAESSRAISSARLWRRRLYTCALSTSSSATTLCGVLILWKASHLDAFSAYPIQTRIPGGAPGGTTGTPEVCPSRSSRTSDSTTQNSCAHDR